ncbi:HAD family phosphatase, partial [Actinosynnema sp. NPDC023658]
MTVEAVLWDMDGTLLDSEKLWDIPLHEFVEKLGGTLSAPTRQAMVGSSTARTMTLLFTEAGIDHPSPEDLVDGAAWIS